MNPKTRTMAPVEDGGFGFETAVDVGTDGTVAGAGGGVPVESCAVVSGATVGRSTKSDTGPSVASVAVLVAEFNDSVADFQALFTESSTPPTGVRLASAFLTRRRLILTSACTL
jgi:hypothetical protein